VVCYTGDEHARALEEQWIEGDLTADTATSGCSLDYRIELTASSSSLLCSCFAPLSPHSLPSSPSPSPLTACPPLSLIRNSLDRRHVHLHPARSPHRLPPPPHLLALLPRTPAAKLLRPRSPRGGSARGCRAHKGRGQRASPGWYLGRGCR